MKRPYVVKVWRIGDGGALLPEGEYSVEAVDASAAMYQATGLAIGRRRRVPQELERLEADVLAGVPGAVDELLGRRA